MRASSIATISLTIDIIIVVFAIYQQYFEWNIFPPAIEGFIKVSFFSFQVFTLMIFLAAVIDEMKDINKSLKKIADRI